MAEEAAEEERAVAAQRAGRRKTRPWLRCGGATTTIERSLGHLLWAQTSWGVGIFGKDKTQ